MSKEPLEYLKHIQDECIFIKSVIVNDLSRDEFEKNETLKRAVIRSIEIIGEAAKKLPDDFKVKFSTVEWKNISGMRDRLIHDYMGVNYTIVWDVIRNKIPELYNRLTEIIGNK